MHVLEKYFYDRIATGLSRGSVKTASKWAEKYRVMGKPIPGKWTFKYHPWLREMHDSKAPINIGKKSAQAGYTETILNDTFFHMDVEGENCMYILPNKNPDATNFSSSRFDPAIELSPHLTKMFNKINNVGLKRAGNASLYITGSNSRSALKSVPVPNLYFDELDEMNQENLSLAEERSSGQFVKKSWKISTPTLPEFGIAKLFANSSQESFFFPCPSCSKQITLTYPDCIVMIGDNVNDPRLTESHIICPNCKSKIEHETKHIHLGKGKWVAAFPDRVDVTRGFYVNQLYSSTTTPGEITKKYIEAQVDKTAEQEFWNSKMGIEHLVEGSRLDDTIINQCIHSYRKVQAKTSGLITMGVDVGHKWLHVEIDEWEIAQSANVDINTSARPRLIFEGKVPSFNDLDRFMFDFSILFCVVDSQPDRRNAFDFSNRFWGRVKLCTYGRSVTGKTISINTEQNDNMIFVDRTSWLDLSLGRFHRGKKGILLPIDVSMEYRQQIKAPVRRYDKDSQGNPVGKYVEVGPDHFAHARNYAEIALPLAIGLGRSQNMGSVV